MYGHPRAYWADPDEERHKRMVAFVAGLVAGTIAGLLVGCAWLTWM